MANRTPTAIKLLRGSHKKHPERFRDVDREPVPNEDIVEETPGHLDKPLKTVWDEIRATIPAGAAGDSDRVLLELALRLTYKMRHEPDEMQSSDYTNLTSALGRLGLTPVGRSRIRIPERDKPNKYAQYGAGSS